MKIFFFTLILLFVVGLLVPSSLIHAQLPQLSPGATPDSGCFNGFEEISPGVKVPCTITGTGPAGQTSLGGFVLYTIDIAILIIGSITVLLLMVGAFWYITAMGNEEQVESGKKMMRNSLIGLIIVILSFVIVSAITRVLLIGSPF